MMRVHLSATVPVRGPIDVDLFRSDPAAWLPSPARAMGADLYRVRLHAGPLHHDIVLDIGDVWIDGEGSWRAITWEPLDGAGDPVDAGKFLPTFGGEIGLIKRPGSGERASLTLFGGYSVPGGAPGLIVDRVLLRRVAQQTATDMLERIGAALQVVQPADVPVP